MQSRHQAILPRAETYFPLGRFAPAPVEIDTRPVITRMAETLISLNAEDPAGATRRGLLCLGFTSDEIAEHFDAAELRANGMFIRHINDEPTDEPEPDHLVLARMRVAIGENFPSLQALVADLFGRAFSKDQQDRLFNQAYALAIKDASGLAATGAVAVQ